MNNWLVRVDVICNHIITKSYQATTASSQQNDPMLQLEIIIKKLETQWELIQKTLPRQNCIQSMARLKIGALFLQL